MNMDSNNGFEHHGTPEELRPIEGALDRLAEHERDSAPMRLEQGVFLASYGKLRVQGESEVAGRIRPVMLSRLRLAAAVGIIGAAAALWLGYSAMVGGPGAGAVQVASTTGLEDDVDFVLDLRSSSDDLAILGDRIDTLFMDTSSVGDSLMSEPTMILLGDGAL